MKQIDKQCSEIVRLKESVIDYRLIADNCMKRENRLRAALENAQACCCCAAKDIIDEALNDD